MKIKLLSTISTKHSSSKSSASFLSPPAWKWAAAETKTQVRCLTTRLERACSIKYYTEFPLACAAVYFVDFITSQDGWKKSELPNNLHESFPCQMLILCKQQLLYSSKLWSSGSYSLLVVANCTTVTCGTNLANSVKKWH